MTDDDLKTRELGKYKDRLYHLGRRAEPTEQQPDDFAVLIYYRDPVREEREVIARVDNAHGFTHFDRLYRRDQPKDRVDWTYWEAVEKFFKDWRTYARSYDQAHE